MQGVMKVFATASYPISMVEFEAKISASSWALKFEHGHMAESRPSIARGNRSDPLDP